MSAKIDIGTPKDRGCSAIEYAWHEDNHALRGVLSGAHRRTDDPGLLIGEISGSPGRGSSLGKVDVVVTLPTR